MKYFFRTLLAFVLVGITVYAVYFATSGGKVPSKEQQPILTTASKAPATEKYANKRLLANVKGTDYSLYITDDALVLFHGEKAFEYKIWSTFFALEKPKMYCFDVDSDGQKDIVVRGVSGQDQETGDYVYDLYILHRTRTEKENYELVTASQTTWHYILDDAIVEEISQLKTCKKFAQFAMTVKGTDIQYNEKTGIAEKNAGFAGYFRSLQDKDGKYMTVDHWNKGKGSYYISKENKLCCEVEVLVSYAGSQAVQNAGKIRFEMSMNAKKASLYITPGTMVFRAAEDYIVSDPKDVAKKPWSTRLNNSANPSGSEEINWIKYSIPVDAKVFTATADLTKEETDIVFVDSVTVSEKAIIMTAKNGCTFDDEATSKGEYSVIINKGTDSEYEISYAAALGNDGKTLTISFDKTYPQSAVKTVDISFGTK